MAEQYIIGNNAQFNDSVEILKDLTLYGVVENSTDFAVKIKGDEKLRITSEGALIGDTISHIGDTDTKIRFPENDVISFETAGSERLRIATPSARGIVSLIATDAQDVIHITTGNVSGDTFSNVRGDNQSGIRIRGGGSYGGGMIELAGGLRNTDPGIIKFHTGTDVTANNPVRMRIDDDAVKIQSKLACISNTETNIEFSGTNQIVFNAANTEKMRLIGNGNLGIGTDDPGAYKVVISAHGASENGGGLLLRSRTTNFAAPYLNILGRNDDDNTSFPYGGVIYLTGQRTDAKVNVNKVLGAVVFGGNHSDGSESNQRYAASVIGLADGSFDSATDMPTALAFMTGDTGRLRSALNLTAGTERMRITSDGQVLINTTSSINSQAYLEVQGGTSHGNTNYIQTWKGDTDNIAIRNQAPGDYEFTNSQQGNQVAIYDGTGGVRLEYADGGNFIGMNNNIAFSNRIDSLTTSGGSNVRVASGGELRKQSSSRRFKDNIREYVGVGVSAIKQMVPKLWEDHNGDGTKLGFIAEEIHDLGLTNAVIYDPYIGGSEIGIGITYGDSYGNGSTPVTKTGETLDDEVLVVGGLDEMSLIAELVIAVKQLTARIETLESGG